MTTAPLITPPEGPSRPERLRDFLAAVAKAEREPLGEEFTESSAPVIEGLLLCLCAVYGISSSVASGREPDRHGSRFNYPRAMVSVWRRTKLKPHRVVEGLKTVPDVFAKFPTAGLLEDHIRGELRDESIPAEFRKQLA